MSGQILQPVSLAAHAKYIDDKLNLIPAKFYFRTEGDENQWKITKYAQNRAGKAPKQRHKSESKRGLKISKFKEENIKSIHQQQKERNKGGVMPILGNTVRANTIEDLKARLQTRLKTLRRGFNTGPKKPRPHKNPRPARPIVAEEDKDEEEEEEEVPEQTQETAVPTPEDQPSKDIVFSTLDFGDDASAPSQKKRKKPIASLIKKAEAKRRRINELKRTQEGKKLLEQDAWDSMMKRAKREKVRDNLKMLKKTQKRKQASKRRSKRAWKERGEAQEQQMKAKADKRKANIRNRGKPKEKATAAAEQRRPGFEGRKTNFLNDPANEKKAKGGKKKPRPNFSQRMRGKKRK